MIAPFLAMLVAPVGAPHALARAAAELRASEAALRPHSDGFGLDKDPKAPALLDRHWAALRQWTEAWLDANGVRAQGRLGEAAKAAEKYLEVSTEPIASGVLAVSAQEGETGTIFIVRQTPRGFRTAWTLSAPGRAALLAYPTLAGWTAVKAPYGCRDRRPNCGPLYGSVGPLPPQRDKQKRFYIEAGYAGQGGTIGGQISIWRWNGRTAKPLLAGTYAYMIEQPYGVSVDRGVLHIGVKSEFKTFSACGSCNGRQMDWRIAVGPDRVRDLGRTDRYPELVFVDNLLDRLFHHRQPPAGAATANLSVLRRQLRDADVEYSFGMLMGWTLRRRGHFEELCISPDPETDTFTFDTSSPRLRLVSVREGPLHGCGEQANH
ncbi:MAG TPA: hypothetical protein VH331_02060 [Allosphingosinicella sp.]|jgi:hypothetical protein|nr:hypothetical protein [Allosphingosinicella sp.]